MHFAIVEDLKIDKNYLINLIKEIKKMEKRPVTFALPVSLYI